MNELLRQLVLDKIFQECLDKTPDLSTYSSRRRHLKSALNDLVFEALTAPGCPIEFDGRLNTSFYAAVDSFMRRQGFTVLKQRFWVKGWPTRRGNRPKRQA